MDADRIPLFDAHVHLQAAEFSTCLDPVLSASRQAGLAAWCCNGSMESDWPQVLDLAQHVTGIFGLTAAHEVLRLLMEEA